MTNNKLFLYGTPHPQPDESPISWILRAASKHRMNIDVFLGYIDITISNNLWGMSTLKDLDIKKASYTLQVPPKSLQLIKKTSILFSNKNQNFNSNINLDNFKICPKCFFEEKEKYIRWKWQIASNSLCLKHSGLVLQQKCPHCSQHLSWQGVKRPTMNIKYWIKSPIYKCAHCDKYLIPIYDTTLINNSKSVFNDFSTNTESKIKRYNHLLNIDYREWHPYCPKHYLFLKLPLRGVTESEIKKCRNNTMTLLSWPHTIHLKSNIDSYHFPSFILPRRLILWFTSQVLLHNKPNIIFPKSKLFSQLIAGDIAKHCNKANIRFLTQLHNLINCEWEIFDKDLNSTKNKKIRFSKVGSNYKEPLIWPKEVILSDEIFQLFKDEPLHVNKKALDLSPYSGLNFDITCWLTQLSREVPSEKKFTWFQLSALFMPKYRIKSNISFILKKHFNNLTEFFPNLAFEYNKMGVTVYII